MNLASKARTAVDLVATARFADAWTRLRTHLRSETLSYGLRRDLKIPFDAPAAKIPITVRPIVDSDMALFRGPHDENLTADGSYQRMHRLRMLEQGIGKGFAAVDSEDRVAYVQWIFLPKDNEDLANHFQGLFPYLDPGYALLEGAFTFEAFRGKGVMSTAMALIAEEAAKAGADFAITFVTHNNVPSLKGCERAGFHPYCARAERYRLFRLGVDFTPLESQVAHENSGWLVN